MTPPINIDGTQITGATIDGQDVSAITVDGQTAFSAIPDSVVIQYLKDDFTTSNWPDSEGGFDLSTINGLTFDSGAFNSNGGVSGDGTDDFGQDATYGTFGSSLGTDWAVSIPFQTSAGEDNVILGTVDTSGVVFVVFANGAGFATNIDNLGLRLADSSNNQIRMDTDSSFADGDPHHLIINKTATSVNGIGFYVDDMTNPASTNGSDDGLSGFGDFQHDITFFARNVEGSVDNYYAGNLGTVRWFNDSLTESERQTVHDGLDWT